MEKQNKYRFTIKLDETDEIHRKVAEYLNSLGRKKSRVIARAILAYMERGDKSVIVDSIKEDSRQDGRETPQNNASQMLSLDMQEYDIDPSEIALIQKNYAKFDVFK